MENEKYIVYIIEDSSLEDAYVNDDINAFTETLNVCDNLAYEYDDLVFGWHEESFDTEKEAIAYLNGVFRGCDDRSPCGKIALKSWIEEDKPYIEILTCN